MMSSYAEDAQLQAVADLGKLSPMLRLSVEIMICGQYGKARRVELVDAAIPCYRKKGRPDQWFLDTEELLTPLGFPLKIHIHRGTGSPSIVVESMETELIRSWTDHELELRLPTEEILHVLIVEDVE